MKIVYNNLLKNDLPEYLISQEGITKADIINEEEMNSIILDGDLDPFIVAKYIDLFQESKWSTMFSFNKENYENLKEYVYMVDDICCEYCHMNFIRKLFDNENIIAANSDFSYDKSAYNIKYNISYKDSYPEEELEEYIKKSL